WRTIGRGVEEKFLYRGVGVLGGERLVLRRGVHRHIQSAFGALGRLPLADQNGSWKAGLIFVPESYRLVSGGNSQLGKRLMSCAALADGSFCCDFRNRARALLAAANHVVLGGNADADGRSEAIDAIADHGKPPPRVEQIRYGIADVGELQSRHRAVVSRLDRPFIFKSQSVAAALGQAIEQGDADGRVLADP